MDSEKYSLVFLLVAYGAIGESTEEVPFPSLGLIIQYSGLNVTDIKEDWCRFRSMLAYDSSNVL
jgi:hypothetical protein